jgi:hypothetical protein
MGAYFKATLKGDIKAHAQAQMRARAKRLEVLLAQEEGEIIARTQSGRSITGSGFRAYSKGYAKRKGEKTGSTKPNLVGIGDKKHTGGLMLQSIRSSVKVSGNIITGIISFLPSQAIKAFVNQVLYKRPFFGLSKEQKQRIVKGLNSI